MKRRVGFALVIALISISLFSGCTRNTTSNKLSDKKDTLYQVSTINSLLAGNYDGFRSVDELKFDTLDGELVMIDNKVYKIKATGKVEEMGNSITVPFVAVTYFDKDISTEATNVNNYDSLQQELDKLIENKDLFYAIRIDGTFKYLKARSVPKQEKPYPVLSEVTKDQPTFEFTNITGSLIGFWCPAYVGGINVPGYHLHFISEDRTKGGHLLEVSIDKASVYVDKTDAFNMDLPQLSVQGDFSDMEQEINKVEK